MSGDHSPHAIEVNSSNEPTTALGKLLRDRLTPKVRLYLAGPMTGYPDLNFPAFHAAAKSLRAAGYEVVNPAELTAHGLFALLSAKLQRRWAGWLRCSNWRQCMVIDIRELVLCDGIALLPCWENSKGASLEYRIARGLDMQAERVEGWLAKATQTADTGPDTAGGELWSA